MTGDTTDATMREPSPARTRDGPDFICMGLMKGGTQWLYDQLQHHPEFWMPPHKELHFFDKGFTNSKIKRATSETLSSPEAIERMRAKHDLRPLDERDLAFFRKAEAFHGSPDDFDFYASLFEAAGHQLTGDVTPGYSTLDNRMVRRISERFGQVKVIMMLRDPVARLWSQWSMRHYVRERPQDTFDARLGGRLKAAERPAGSPYDLDAFKAWAARDGVSDRSYPTKIARRWRRHFDGRFTTFFLDDVAARPDETRAAILKTIGASPVASGPLAAGFNRKERDVVYERTPEIRAFMKDLFEDERRKCAEMFGGPALKWPDAPY